MRIRLGILDQDELYKDRLTKYFGENYADKVDIFSFTSQVKLESFLENGTLDVLLADEHSIPDSKSLPEEISFAYWADTANVEIRNVRTICKYQKAELIYKEILGLYAETQRSITDYYLGSGRGCGIVTFLGAAGGVGTSTAAAGCAQRAAALGKRVLFLDMTQLGMTDMFFTGTGSNTLSDVLYTIKSNRSNLFLKLESMARQDESGVNFYASCDVALDARDAGEEDVSTLIHCLSESGNYDLIVIDADPVMSDKQQAILNLSNLVILVSNGTPVANRKLSKLVNAFRLDATADKKLLRKVVTLYNKFGTGAQLAPDMGEFLNLGSISVYKQATAKQIAQEIATKSLMDSLIVQKRR